MKSTQSSRQALERLAHAMGYVLEREGSRYVVVRADGLVRVKPKDSLEALAWLADLARREPIGGELRTATGWTGEVRTRGLSGWETEALQWLTERRQAA